MPSTLLILFACYVQIDCTVPFPEFFWNYVTIIRKLHLKGLMRSRLYTSET